MVKTQQLVKDLATQEPDLLHSEIANRIGISRERVRQILGNCGNKKRVAKAMASKQNKVTLNPWKFKIYVRSWLKAIGFGYCCECHAAKPLTEMCSHIMSGGKHNTRCLACNAARVREYSKTSRGKQVKCAYVEANRERLNAYWRNWRLNKKKGEIL